MADWLESVLRSLSISARASDKRVSDRLLSACSLALSLVSDSTVFSSPATYCLWRSRLALAMRALRSGSTDSVGEGLRAAMVRDGVERLVAWGPVATTAEERSTGAADDRNSKRAEPASSANSASNESSKLSGTVTRGAYGVLTVSIFLRAWKMLVSRMGRPPLSPPPGCK